MNRQEKEPVVDGSFYAFLAGILIGFLLAMMTSCTTTKYVEVPGPTHTEIEHRVDTFMLTDTLIDKQTTIIREVDAETMAQYGIKLQNAERAWLVQSQQLLREIERLKQMRTDTVVKTDSIPYPVEVPVEVPAELTWWQQLKIHLGGICFWLIIGAAGVGIVRLWLKIKP